MADRQSRLVGALMVVVAAIAFSGKAVIIKLAYRHGVDAVTLLALRMLFSAPLFSSRIDSPRASVVRKRVSSSFSVSEISDSARDSSG